MESFQNRFQTLNSMFQHLNVTVNNLTRTQSQISHLASEANFGVKQLGSQLTVERDTKVNKTCLS
jgi:hypothetical protein